MEKLDTIAVMLVAFVAGTERGRKRGDYYFVMGTKLEALDASAACISRLSVPSLPPPPSIPFSLVPATQAVMLGIVSITLFLSTAETAPREHAVPFTLSQFSDLMSHHFNPRTPIKVRTA